MWLSTRTATFSSQTGLSTGGLVVVITLNWVTCGKAEDGEGEAAGG